MTGEEEKGKDKRNDRRVRRAWIRSVLAYTTPEVIAVSEYVRVNVPRLKHVRTKEGAAHC